MKSLKHLVVAVLLSLTGLSANAQSPIYLFEDFTDGTVVLKNRSVVKTKFNLDIFHDKFLYMDGDQIMEMTDFSNVSTVLIGDRTFVPQGSTLYEVIELDPENNLLVKWHRKNNPMGKKGAYEQIAHASSTQSLDPNYYSPSVTKEAARDEMRTISENRYGMLSNGKFRTFTDKRSFLKLFPDRKAELETFINEQHLLFTDFDDVITIARFAIQ